LAGPAAKPFVVAGIDRVLAKFRLVLKFLHGQRQYGGNSVPRPFGCGDDDAKVQQ